MLSIQRVIAAAAILAASASCASQNAGPWQKAGTSEQMMSQDTAECREAAQEEARRRYPYSGGSGIVLSQQRDDYNRVASETSLSNNCMLSRGYVRAPVPRSPEYSAWARKAWRWRG
jgi:hypothetical protein